MTCHFARRDEISIVSLDPYPRAHPRWPLGDGPSRDAPAPPSQPRSVRLSSHFTTLDPHVAHYSPPPPASRAATARIANSYAAKVMADAGALFTSPGANPL